MGSGDGTVLSGNKPLPEPMLIQFSVTIWVFLGLNGVEVTLDARFCL